MSLADRDAIARIQALSPQASQWAVDSYDCLVARRGQGVVGFLVSRSTAPGEREILNLAVHPAHRREGIADLLIQEEFKRGPGTWFLEVRESNSAAIALYQWAGFQIAGHRENYYDDPVEAAIVMRFHS